MVGGPSALKKLVSSRVRHLVFDELPSTSTSLKQGSLNDDYIPKA